MILKSKRLLLSFILLSMLFVAPFIYKVNAQGGGGAVRGEMLNPTDGPRGTTVTVNFNITNYIALHGSTGNPQNIPGMEYRIGWDIGGYPKNAAATLDEVRSPGWTVLGKTQVDSFGNIATTVTIPTEAQVGDNHFIYAIPPDSDLESNVYYWSDTFHITEGPAVSPLSTPTPSPHPNKCTLTVNWEKDYFTVKILEDTKSGESYSAEYPWGTTVSLYAIFDSSADTSVVFDGWEWTDSSGTHGKSDSTVYIDMNSDVTATPKVRSSGIPGFPFESIAIGLFLSLGLLYMTKKKSKLSLGALR
jgi:hypothetical protein